VNWKSLFLGRRASAEFPCEGPALCFQDTPAGPAGSVALDRCVGHLYFGFGRRGWNPFTQAVREYLAHGHWQSLEKYYREFQPQSLAEAYFLRNRPRWGVLNERAPFARLKPWRASEILMSGHDGAGNQNFGPVTRRKFEQEARKYEAIAESVRKHGYRPERYGMIRGYFLIDQGGDYVFRITQGMHRTPVLDALGWDRIPVALDPLLPGCISLDTLRHWPRVADGTFSPELAAYLFRRHFWDRGDIKRLRFGERR
jgi:hypothetical protein